MSVDLSQFAPLGSLYWGSLKRGESNVKVLSLTTDSPLLRVECIALSTAAQKVKPNWVKAGWLIQRSIQGDSVRSYWMRLGLNLVRPTLTYGAYRLSFDPAPWLPSLRVNLRRYTGTMPPSDCAAIAQALGVGTPTGPYVPPSILDEPVPGDYATEDPNYDN